MKTYEIEWLTAVRARVIAPAWQTIVRARRVHIRIHAMCSVYKCTCVYLFIVVLCTLRGRMVDSGKQIVVARLLRARNAADLHGGITRKYLTQNRDLIAVTDRMPACFSVDTNLPYPWLPYSYRRDLRETQCARSFFFGFVGGMARKPNISRTFFRFYRFRYSYIFVVVINRHTYNFRSGRVEQITHFIFNTSSRFGGSAITLLLMAVVLSRRTWNVAGVDEGRNPINSGELFCGRHEKWNNENTDTEVFVVRIERGTNVCKGKRLGMWIKWKIWWWWDEVQRRFWFFPLVNICIGIHIHVKCIRYSCTTRDNEIK